MSNLQILSNSIRTFENLYNLTDLHIASGGERKHQPSNFIRLDTTKELIAEIESETPNVHAVKTIRGTQGGTYVCEELVLSYAMWISPKFHLIVLRAFLSMHKNEQLQNSQQLALPEPEKTFSFDFTERELQTLAWVFFILLRNIDTFRTILPALEKLGSTLTPSIYGQAYDYHFTVKDLHRIVSRLTEQFEVDPDSNWRVLKHVRNFDPKAKNFIQ